VIQCADEAEAERVRAWVAWVLEDRARRAYEERQRQLDARALHSKRPAPQDFLGYRTRWDGVSRAG
jgi:hypothetical protein